MKVQAALEARMADQGVERFRRQAAEARAEGRATQHHSMKVVLDVAINPLAQAITNSIEAERTATKWRRSVFYHKIKGVDPEAVAFITAKMLVDTLTKHSKLTPMASHVGRAVEMEARLASFSKSEKWKDYAYVLMEDVNAQTTHAEHRRRLFREVLTGKGDGWAAWSDRDCILVGLKLIELIISATGLFETRTPYVGRRKVTMLHPTQRFLDWVNTIDAQLEVLAPSYLPCVIPPKDWTGVEGGGYHTDAFAYPLRLVKTRFKAHDRELKKADLVETLTAVNTLQRTAWTIDKRVLAVAKGLLTGGAGVAGLPPMNSEPLPTKPHDMDTNEEAKKAWIRQAADTHTRNHSWTSKRLQVLKTLSVAEEYAECREFFFPYQLDFRGRIYSVPQYLNPQGTDLAKGLLVFSKAEPVETAEARRWFLIHGANSYGVDKVSFDERVGWVVAHQEAILAVAENPFDYLWWTEAESPFVFLSWCFEYADADRDIRAGVVPVSRVPITMDGSCNGLQHFAAMLRDPVAGKAVNLLPSDNPADVYQEVADVVMSKLSAEAIGMDTDWWTAERWFRFGVDRKITKRPVMVVPYGGTLNATIKYTHAAAKERIDAGTENPFVNDFRPACTWLARIVWESISEVVVSAREAMTWLQTCANIVSKSGRYIKWVTPSGFPVVQAYPIEEFEKIHTFFLGRRYQPQYQLDRDGTLDVRKQVNGVAPNFVHSMDAAVLVKTVNSAAAVGVNDFVMVHDSYGTTAAKAGFLAEHLRRVFCAFYTDHDVLQEFLSHIPSAQSGDIPPLPKRGDLDLQQVNDSLYFFA